MVADSLLGWVVDSSVGVRERKAACETMRYLSFSHMHTKHTHYTHWSQLALMGDTSVRLALQNGQKESKGPWRKFWAFCGGTVVKWHNMTTAFGFSIAFRKLQRCRYERWPQVYLVYLAVTKCTQFRAELIITPPLLLQLCWKVKHNICLERQLDKKIKKNGHMWTDTHAHNRTQPYTFMNTPPWPDGPP